VTIGGGLRTVSVRKAGTASSEKIAHTSARSSVVTASRIINFQPTVFPYLTVLGELAVGVGLTLGFLTPISALVALLLNLNYITVSGVRPRDISVNNCFRVDQGQNFVMIVAEVVIFFAGAGAVWSLDNLLGLF
jgi:thiosulfate dehydrogenase [quinone] large subunit